MSNNFTGQRCPLTKMQIMRYGRWVHHTYLPMQGSGVQQDVLYSGKWDMPLASWLSWQGNWCLLATVKAYLLAREEITIASCVHENNINLAMVAKLSNRLGWDSFVEGRISKHWLMVATPLLWRHQQYLLPFAWGWQLITKMHNVVHKQGVYQNYFIHFKGRDGLTMPQHYAIITQVKSFSLIDPKTLLPHYNFCLKPTLMH